MREDKALANRFAQQGLDRSLRKEIEGQYHHRERNLDLRRSTHQAECKAHHYRGEEAEAPRTQAPSAIEHCVLASLRERSASARDFDAERGLRFPSCGIVGAHVRRKTAAARSKETSLLAGI